jgi:chemotaxis protein CheD
MTAHARKLPPVANPGAQAGAVFVKVDPGAYIVSAQADHVLVTVLGSCVAACLRDPLAGIGGMNHFMLPSSTHGVWAGIPSSLRYGNFAMEQMINEILRGGGRRSRLQAKLFGGASVIGNTSIGRSNADFVESYLHEEGIEIIGSDLRGSHARRVHYSPVSGQAFMRNLPREDASVARHEKTYAAKLDVKDVEGSVELF